MFIDLAYMGNLNNNNNNQSKIASMKTSCKLTRLADFAVQLSILKRYGLSWSLDFGIIYVRIGSSCLSRSFTFHSFPPSNFLYVNLLLSLYCFLFPFLFHFNFSLRFIFAFSKFLFTRVMPRVTITAEFRIALTRPYYVYYICNVQNRNCTLNFPEQDCFFNKKSEVVPKFRCEKKFFFGLLLPD